MFFSKLNAYQILFKDDYYSKFKNIVSYLLVFTIIISVLSSVLETEYFLRVQFGYIFLIIEYFATFIFVIEYFIRLWCVSESDIYKGLYGRFRYILTPTALLDLVAILPIFLFLSLDNQAFAKLLRLIRVIRLMKLGVFSESINIISLTLKRQLPELLVALPAGILASGFTEAHNELKLQEEQTPKTKKGQSI